MVTRWKMVKCAITFLAISSLVSCTSSARLSNRLTKRNDYITNDKPLAYSIDATQAGGVCGLEYYDRLVSDKRREFLAERLATRNHERADLREMEREWRLIYEQIVPIQYRALDLSQIIAEEHNSDDQREKKLRQQNITNTLIPVRLSVRYDSAMVEDLRDYPGGHLKYIRNLIFTTQMIFEQAELWQRIKLNLVVVSLEQLSHDLPPNLSVELLTTGYFSTNFGQDDLGLDRADLTVILMRRGIWGQKPGTTDRKIINGVASHGTFCNYEAALYRQVVVRADTYGTSAFTLAHEIAHTLNAYHDGEGPQAMGCSPDQFVMSPFAGAGKTNWSYCTVNQIEGFLMQFIACVLNPGRLQMAAPISKEYDFRQWIRPPEPPGLTTPLIEQCQVTLDRLAEPVMDTRSFEPRYETCAFLFCQVAPTEPFVPVGPALSGSECLNYPSGQEGRCKQYKCI